MNHPKAIVHLNRLARNYKTLSKSLDRKRLMAVVKANAYGHGAVECSKTLEDQGCDFFSVFTTEEAKELRNAGLKSDILILSKYVLLIKINSKIIRVLLSTLASIN